MVGRTGLAQSAARWTSEIADTGEANLVALSVVESRSMPRVGPGDVYITGTRPDGTVWREPPAPPAP